MALQNNYDTSSSGLDLEVNIFLDTDMSQINFDENITENKYLGKYIYTDFGNLAYHLKKKWGHGDMVGIYDLIDLDDLYTFEGGRGDKLKLIKFLVSEYGEYYSDLKDLEITEIIESIFDNGLNEIDNIISNSGISYKKLYEIIPITGYSQGDRDEVIILTEFLKELWGIDKIDLDSTSVDITHYFYDSPIHARCEINGEEYISEKFDGQYIEFDKGEFIEEVVSQFKGDKTLLKAELEKITPNTLEYI